jgi:DNA-binding NarL/FixJ family response regulator
MRMNRERPIRVAVVEDNTELLDELGALIAESPATELAGRYTTGTAALTGIPAARPDVTLIDLGLPDMSGVEVIRRLRGEDAETEFLVITVYDDDQHLFAALEAGAVGYIVKERAVNAELIAAIEEAVQGGAPMSLGIARRVLAHFRRLDRGEGRAAGMSRLRLHRDAGREAPMQGLSKREHEVLEHLAKGFGAKKAAEMLNISYATIRCHQKSIYKKLHVNSLLEAVTVFRDSG